MSREVLCTVLPIRIDSIANRREHWRAQLKRKSSQRQTARMMLRAVFGSAPPLLPEVITLTRIGPRTLDSDNLAGGFKHVRDGVADWLMMDDGSPHLTWLYAQRKGKPGEYAAEVVIESAVAEAAL